jgi:hypothetical protein
MALAADASFVGLRIAHQEAGHLSPRWTIARWFRRGVTHDDGVPAMRTEQCDLAEGRATISPLDKDAAIGQNKD